MFRSIFSLMQDFILFCISQYSPETVFQSAGTQY